MAGTRTVSATKQNARTKSKNNDKSNRVESSQVGSIHFPAFNKLVESINHQPLNVMLIRSAKDKKSMICQLYTHTQRDTVAGVRSLKIYAFMSVRTSERARVFVYLPVYRLQSTRLSTEKKESFFTPMQQKKRKYL